MHAVGEMGKCSCGLWDFEGGVPKRQTSCGSFAQGENWGEEGQTHEAVRWYQVWLCFRPATTWESKVLISFVLKFHYSDFIQR